MIARLWKGLALPENAEEYVGHLEKSVLPELQQIDGFQGLQLMRRESSDSVEFIVMTFWDSMESIHSFAGENAEVAVVAPAAQALFREYDTRVKHFEVVLTTP